MTVAIVLASAIIFGFVALPRLGSDPLVGSRPRDIALPRLEKPGPDNASPKVVKFSELAGKAVILDFWASWCPPCREQAPIVDRVSRSFAGRGLVALGIVPDDDADNALRYLAAHPVGYPSVVDETLEATRAFRVDSLPTLVALDRSGRVVAVRHGLVREAELKGLAEAALKD